MAGSLYPRPQLRWALPQPCPGSFKAGWGWTAPSPAAGWAGHFPTLPGSPGLSPDASLEGAILSRKDLGPHVG